MAFRGIFTFAPMVCALTGGVLVLGTSINQHQPESDEQSSSSPMAGMDHSAMGGMDHSAMGGMDHSAMGGMDHSAMQGNDPAAPGTPTGTTPGGSMNMSRPGMAAKMPGGVHTQCADARTCTTIFAVGADGVAQVLGVKIMLLSLKEGVARLSVGGHKVAVHAGKSLRVGDLTLTPLRLRTDEISLRVSRRA